jgi:hypothetical protein
MNHSLRLRFFLIIALFQALSNNLKAAHSPVEEMAGAAANLLAALTPDQQGKAFFELKHDERINWHFIPKPRKGLPFKEMTPGQQRLAHALLSTGMSQRGYMKSTTIMSLEDILKETEQGRGPNRDPEMYFVSIFGKPDPKGTWGWRVEGHHLALNFTIVKGEHISVTPSFFGDNPAEVKTGPRQGLRTLAAEEDLARQLVQSLTDEQKKVAIYTNTAPSDILTGTNRNLRPLVPGGLAAAQMTKPQTETLWDLVQEYVRRYRSEIADKDLEKIQKAGLEKLNFAWAGSIERGKPHYYRVQGPTFLMEYDNTQNGANHIHAVWRDYNGDFGEDLLKKHYDESHR